MQLLTTKMTKKSRNVLSYILLAILFTSSFLFVRFNYGLYERPIAKVTDVRIQDSIENVDMYDNKDLLTTQEAGRKGNEW